MFVPRISQGASEVSFHISLRDFFRSSGLAAETLLKAVKKIKTTSFLVGTIFAAMVWIALPPGLPNNLCIQAPGWIGDDASSVINTDKSGSPQHPE